MSESQRVSINISTTALLKVALVVLLLVVLYIIRDVLLLILISMVVASAMDPLVGWLYSRAKFPRGLSVVLVYLVFVGLVAGIIYFVIPPMVIQFKELAGRIDDYRSELTAGTSNFSRFWNEYGLGRGVSSLGKAFTDLTANLFQTTLGVFSGLLQGLTVLAISFYLIASENGMKNFVRSLVPFKHQAYALRLTDKIQNKIARWLLGQLILSFSIFLATYIGLTILGVKFALALSLLAGLLEIVPYLGPILSAIPAIFVAFVQSPPLSLFVVLLYVVIQQLENYILVPKIMGRSVGANPLVILLALLIGFKFAGIIGMLLAVPVVSATLVFLNDFRESRESQEIKP